MSIMINGLYRDFFCFSSDYCGRSEITEEDMRTLIVVLVGTLFSSSQGNIKSSVWC